MIYINEIKKKSNTRYTLILNLNIIIFNNISYNWNNDLIYDIKFEKIIILF